MLKKLYNTFLVSISTLLMLYSFNISNVYGFDTIEIQGTLQQQMYGKLDCGAKLMIHHKSGFYGVVTYQDTNYYYKLRGPDFSYFGFGFGYRKALYKTDKFTLSGFGSISYYIPDVNYNDRGSNLGDTTCRNEDLYQELNDKYLHTHGWIMTNGQLPQQYADWYNAIGTLAYDYYEMDMEPTFGGEIGIHAAYDITKYLSVTSAVSYRYVNFPYWLAGKWDSISNGWHETYGEYNASDVQCAFGVMIRW